MNDLLKVLDMSEDFQWNFLVSHQGIQELCEHQLDAFCQKKFKRRILADLAFRLRNEAIHEYFVEASVLICQRIISLFPEDVYEARRIALDWFATRAKPIHWIIAALIAKDKEDE